MPRDQRYITKKVVQYLKKELAESLEQDKESRQKVITELENCEGNCAGFTVLWSYARAIEDDKIKNRVKRRLLEVILKNDLSRSTSKLPESALDLEIKRQLKEWIGYNISREEPKKLGDKEPKADDISHFNSMINLLIQWDGKSNFSSQDKSEIEGFISNILFYQNTQSLAHESQSDFLGNVEDTKSRYFSKHFDLVDPVDNYIDHTNKKAIPRDIVCTKSMVSRFFHELVLDGEAIFVSCDRSGYGGHVFSIYKSSIDNKIYFYDSNDEKGEVCVKDIDELVEKFWERSSVHNVTNNLSRLNYKKMDTMMNEQSDHEGLKSCRAAGAIDYFKDFSFRKIDIKIYGLDRGQHVPRYAHPESSKSMPIKEFYEICSNDHFMKFGIDDADVKSTIERLTSDQFIDILKPNGDAPAADDIKKFLIHYLVDGDAENLSLNFAEVAAKNHEIILANKNLFDEKYGELMDRRMAELRRTMICPDSKKEVGSEGVETARGRLYAGNNEEIMIMQGEAASRVDYIIKNIIQRESRDIQEPMAAKIDDNLVGQSQVLPDTNSANLVNEGNPSIIVATKDKSGAKKLSSSNDCPTP